MHGTVSKVMMPRPRARRRETLVAARGPAMHHRVGHVGVKLEAERMARLEGFDREVTSFRQQFGADGQLKSLTVPVIDMVRPAGTNRVAGRRRPDRVVSDLSTALRVRRDPGAKLLGKHLRPGKFPETAAAPAAAPRSSRFRGERNHPGRWRSSGRRK